jgi:hypothetical protein
MPLTLSNDYKTQKNKLEQTDAAVYLVELGLPTGWFRVTNHVQSVTWNEETWQPFPVALGSLKITSKGEVQTMQISVANVSGILTNYLRENRGLIGYSGNIYDVDLALLNDPMYAVIPELFTIVSSAMKDETVTFTLSLGVDAFAIEGPIESYDRDKFPGMPIVNPRVSIGNI